MGYRDGMLMAIIVRSVIKVHQILGPGFLEDIYRQALVKELRSRGLTVDTEAKVPVYYEGEQVGFHQLDLLVETRVILALRTVEELTGAHAAHLRSYLRATELEVGLLVNFAKERADYRRLEIKRARPVQLHPSPYPVLSKS
jgi:GxxExxY protein